MKGYECFNEMKTELRFYFYRISNFCAQYGAKNKVAPPTAMVHAFTKSGMANSYLFNIHHNKNKMNTYHLVYDILCMSWDSGAFLS